MIVLDVEDAQPLTLIVSFDSQGKPDLLIETDRSFALSAALIFELFELTETIALISLRRNSMKERPSRQRPSHLTHRARLVVK
jgi:hypothetical protein